jgi:hypothetical protein
MPLPKPAQPPPLALPAPQEATQPLPVRAPGSTPPAPFRGLSLRPSDAVDPYVTNRFAPDRAGIQQLTTWCLCGGSLQVTEMTMTEYGLYIVGVCHSCGSPVNGRPGIYRRLLIPLPWGHVPPVEE